MKTDNVDWTSAALDIRTAFLLAPLEQGNRILVLYPPKTLIQAGVVPQGQLWFATGAMLGDICTKSLQGPRLRELLAMMGFNFVDNVEGESRVTAKKIQSSSHERSGTSGSRTGGESNSGGVENRVVELKADSLMGCEGEVDVSGPGIPSQGLIKRALKLLLGALCLKRSTGKVVVTIEQDKQEPDITTWTIAVLALVGVVLLCCGLAVGFARGAWTVGDPRIQRVRVEEVDGSESWTVLSSAELRQGVEEYGSPAGSPRLDIHAHDSSVHPTAQNVTRDGLRRRTQRASSIAIPGPLDPRYLDPSHETLQTLGSPQAQGSSRDTPRARTYADPAPLAPRDYPNPNADWSGERTERGGSRTRAPYGSVDYAARMPAPTVGLVMGDDQVLGVAASYVDDVGYIGLAAGEPSGDHTGAGLDNDVEVPVEQNVETDRAEPDVVITDPSEDDQEGDTHSLPQSSTIRRTGHNQQDEAEELIIVPGWTLRVPPPQVWRTLTVTPAWGGDAGRFHQDIPRGHNKDFWIVDAGRSTLLRVHCKPRRLLFVPQGAGLPAGVSFAELSGRRRSYVNLRDPSLKVPFIEDRFDIPGSRRAMARLWIGRTELEIVREH